MSYLNMISGRSPAGSRAWSRTASMLALIALSACSSVPPAPKAQPTTEAKQPPSPVLPKPAPVKLEGLKWSIVQHGDSTLFALDARGYEALSRNMVELAAWMKEASWQLDFYVRNRQQYQNGAPK